MTSTCPHCGRLIVIDVRKDDSAYSVPWTLARTYADSARRPRFGDAGTAQIEPEFTEATRDTPARSPSPEDFSNPFKRSAVLGCVGLAAGVLLGIKTPDVVFKDDLLWVGIIGLSVFGGSFLLFTFLTDATLWIKETIKNEQDKAPATQQVTVEASLHRKDDEEEHFDLARLPAPSWELLQEFARDVLDENVDLTFSERGAARYGYSQEMFRNLRDRFVGAGWASWRNPEYHEQGVTLLVGGRAILRKIASGEV